MPNPILALLVIAFIAAIAVAFLYWRYRQWPVAQRAALIRRRAAEVRDRLDALMNPARHTLSPAEKLAAELFLKQKQNVDVKCLQAYEHIGPATIEQLRKYGITNLVNAEDHVSAMLFKKKIEGLGEFREKALKAAVEQHLQKEHHRFEDGASVEGAEYRRRLANLSAEEQNRAALQQNEQHALERCLDRLREFEAEAERVTMLAYYMGQPIDVERLNRELPVVEIVATTPPLAAPSTPVAPVKEIVATTPPLAAPSKPVAPGQEIVKPAAAAPSPKILRLHAYCRVAWLIAKVDGRVVASERGAMRKSLMERFDGDAMVARHVDAQLEQSETGASAVADVVAVIRAHVPADEWTAILAFAGAIADTAGGRNELEADCLAELATALNVSTPGATAPVAVPVSAAPSTTPVNHRAALDIDADTPITAELVRRKYAMVLDRTVKAQALGDDYAALARKQAAEAKVAAEALLAPLNEPLEKPTPAAPTDIRHNPELDDLFG